jgi:hypothetical protein
VFVGQPQRERERDRRRERENMYIYIYIYNEKNNKDGTLREAGPPALVTAPFLPPLTCWVVECVYVCVRGYGKVGEKEKKSEVSGLWFMSGWMLYI